MAVNLDQRWSDQLLARLKRSAGFGVALFVALAVAMLVLPLGPAWIDGMVTVSFAVAVAVFASGLRTAGTRAMASLPTLILLTVIFRLSLAVAAGRLVLAEGQAGAIIDAVGRVFVAGNPIVGGVIFILIILIQIVVIARGSARVAEVAARFALDSMPGKQLSIDADLRAGLINSVQADERRGALERQSDFYGSMDGAMRFVQGEAVLTVVTVVLIFAAGVAMGMSRGGFTFAEAARLYGGLTVGVGLVTQVPALLVSLSAGLRVTRAAPPVADRVSNAPVALVIELGATLADRLGGSGQRRRLLDPARRRVADDLGMPLPALQTRVLTTGIDPRGYRLRVYDNPVDSGRIEADDPLEALDVRIEFALRRHAGELLGVEEVRGLLEARRRELPTLIDAVVGPRLSLPQLAEVLQSLVAEDVPIRDLRRILEAIARVGAPPTRPDAWTEHVREALRRTLANRFAEDESRLDVFLVDDEISQLMRSAVQSTAGGPRLGLDPELAGEIGAAARGCDASRPDGVTRTVFLTDPDVRSWLRSLLANDLPECVVLSYRELVPELQVQSIGRLSLSPEPADSRENTVNTEASR